MKHAKFALGAIALLAIAGGALAFKANRGNQTFFKYDAVAHKCTQAVVITYTTDPDDAINRNLPIVQTTYYTAPVDVLNQLCPQTTIYSFN